MTKHDQQQKQQKAFLNVTKEDFLVKDLDKVQEAYAHFEGDMYAGRLPADNVDALGNERVGMTMFWMFQSFEQQASGDSVVIWLNGGPGCSSFNCGVMMEHSPVTQPLRPAGYCCLKPTPDLSVNDYAWTKATTMLYIEHPWGTGFSYGKPEPQTELEASGDLYAFLQNFFQVFPDLATKDLYVFGESYAGMFVPSILHYFHHQNKALLEGKNTKSNNNNMKLNIAGGAMGNGWIDPVVQGPATIDYSWWHGLIDQPTRDALLEIWNRCSQGKNDLLEAPFHPFTVQDDCGIMWGVIQASGHPNEYDITTFDANVDQVTFTSEAFYNMPEVKAALNAPKDHFWHGCQWGEGRRRKLLEQQQQQQQSFRRLYMDNDKPLSMAPYIAELLNADIPLLIYNGDRDMTTNMVGTELVLNTKLTDWNHHKDWLDAPRGLWKTNDYPSGWAKEYKGLTFAVVYNSGHMVPYNQPAPAYDLLVRFLTKKSMIDEELPQIRASGHHPGEASPGLSWMLSNNKKNAFTEAPEATEAEASLEMMPKTTAASIVSSSSSSSSTSAAGITTSSSMSASSPSGLAFGSFLAGIIVTLLIMHVSQRWRRRRNQQQGYTTLPNAMNE